MMIIIFFYNNMMVIYLHALALCTGLKFWNSFSKNILNVDRQLGVKSFFFFFLSRYLEKHTNFFYNSIQKFGQSA